MPEVSVNGTQLYYRESGQGSPVVLIHGMGGDADVWGSCVDALAPQHRVITYARRGFSRSSHAPVDDLARHRADASALIRQLDAAPATVVGWSSGGLVALDLAVNDPDAVSALVLVEAPLHATRRPGLRQAVAAMRAQLLSRFRSDRAALETFLRWAFRHTSGGSRFDRLDPSLREAMLATASASLGDLRAGTGEHLTREQLAALACPVVCLLGELSDPAFTRATRRIERLVPKATVEEIAGVGHDIPLDRPNELAERVAAAASLTTR